MLIIKIYNGKSWLICPIDRTIDKNKLSFNQKYYKTIERNLKLS